MPDLAHKRLLFDNPNCLRPAGAVCVHPPVCPADVEKKETAVCHQRRHLRERLQVIITRDPTNVSMSAITQANISLLAWTTFQDSYYHCGYNRISY